MKYPAVLSLFLAILLPVGAGVGVDIDVTEHRNASLQVDRVDRIPAWTVTARNTGSRTIPVQPRLSVVQDDRTVFSVRTPETILGPGEEVRERLSFFRPNRSITTARFALFSGGTLLDAATDTVRVTPSSVADGFGISPARTTQRTTTVPITVPAGVETVYVMVGNASQGAVQVAVHPSSRRELVVVPDPAPVDAPLPVQVWDADGQYYTRAVVPVRPAKNTILHALDRFVTLLSSVLHM